MGQRGDRIMAMYKCNTIHPSPNKQTDPIIADTQGTLTTSIKELESSLININFLED